MTCPNSNVGKDVKTQFQNDLALEKNAVAEYNAAIATCRKAGDNASADLLQVSWRTKKSTSISWKSSFDSSRTSAFRIILPSRCS